MRTAILNLAALAGVASLALATPAMAGPFTVYDIELPLNDTLTINGPSAPGSLYVGQQVLTTSIGTIDAWCIDIYHDDQVGGGQNVAFATGPITTNNATPTAVALTADQVSKIRALVNYGDALLANPQTASNDVSAAIQLAIWQVEYPTFSYQGNDTLNGLIASYIAVVSDPQKAVRYGGAVTALISQQATQGLVTSDPALVPEPASMALLGAGMLGLGVSRRRKTQAPTGNADNGQMAAAASAKQRHTACIGSRTAL